MHRFSIIVVIATILFLNLTIPPVHAQDDASWLLSTINCLRQSVGSAPLTVNGALTAAAMRQSENLASGNNADMHTGADGSTPKSRAEAAGFSGWVGENVVYGTTASDAFNWWMASSVHYANMTHRNWKEIGIGKATGANGTWYTLVFGAQTWPAIPASASSCGSFTAQAPAAPPAENTQSDTNASGDNQAADAADAPAAPARPVPVIVGIDTFGNTQHQIQMGDTVGDIAIMYGYSWDDVPAILALNNMTNNDVFNLKVGDIFLVPSHAGTFTPNPDLALTASPTVEIPPTAEVIPSATPTIPIETAVSVDVNALPTAIPLPIETASFTPSPTATSTPISVAALSTMLAAAPVNATSTNSVPVAANLDAPPIQTPPSANRITQKDDGSFPVLKVLFGLQFVVLVAVAFGYVIRWRRK